MFSTSSFGLGQDARKLYPDALFPSAEPADKTEDNYLFVLFPPLARRDPVYMTSEEVAQAARRAPRSYPNWWTVDEIRREEERRGGDAVFYRNILDGKMWAVTDEDDLEAIDPLYIQFPVELRCLKHLQVLEDDEEGVDLRGGKLLVPVNEAEILEFINFGLPGANEERPRAKLLYNRAGSRVQTALDNIRLIGMPGYDDYREHAYHVEERAKDYYRRGLYRPAWLLMRLELCRIFNAQGAYFTKNSAFLTAEINRLISGK